MILRERNKSRSGLSLAGTYTVHVMAGVPSPIMIETGKPLPATDEHAHLSCDKVSNRRKLHLRKSPALSEASKGKEQKG
jgi:hypothetical protein